MYNEVLGLNLNSAEHPLIALKAESESGEAQK